MSSIEITLPSELGKFIKEKIQSGEFANPSDVIGIALSLLRDKENVLGDETPELIEQIEIAVKQIEAGEFAQWDAKAFREKAEKLLSNQ